jgi:hypothetical protein
MAAQFINGLPDMNGKPVDGKIFREINRQTENEQKINNTCPYRNRKRFTDKDWTNYTQCVWNWQLNKIINEHKMVLDDLDLQEFNQMTNHFLKPVKPQVNRRR